MSYSNTANDPTGERNIASAKIFGKPTTVAMSRLKKSTPNFGGEGRQGGKRDDVDVVGVRREEQGLPMVLMWPLEDGSSQKTAQAAQLDCFGDGDHRMCQRKSQVNRASSVIREPISCDPRSYHPFQYPLSLPTSVRNAGNWPTRWKKQP
ncbi:hypothetical protein BD410DRAFT_806446 [Rickenella mellea]|uniref:Uncharacterized protein n=1 Tax=Rickenella mellea TaxID=50990 RepID=A0A4Y7PT59_9AGAM|nr:hypothetical protein BD410DRAFT_806446 [Rickenella mellea]